MIGQTIEQYRIIDQLGVGGMGVVYLAEDTNLGRRVAMKFLSTTTKEYRARFLREARAISALTHPNIATVFDYGETPDGKPYIVMELIEGEPLNEKLRDGSLPLPEAVRIISSIAEALGEAHRKGVVHRDVKPSNVVITDRGQVKVLDFGLVKNIAEQSSIGGGPDQKTLPSTRTRSDVIVGTPLYLSPEQATGRSVDGRSDLFALGVVLYECITGQSAFAGASVIEIGAQVLHFTPPLPSTINPQVPPELDRVTMKAIEKKVDARYQTAAEFIAELERVRPNLDDNGYRRGRSTTSIARDRTHSASALTTIIEPFRRPGPNLGIFLLAIVAVALAVWFVLRWWKPAPYKPIPEAQVWYDKGTDALRNGAFLQATKALEQAVATDDKFAVAHARLAEAWFELDYGDNAKDEILKAHSLAPDLARLAATDRLQIQAINASIVPNTAEAVQFYSELVKETPDEPRVYVDLGRAYEKNEESGKALENYLEASRRDPQYATAFLRAGTIYARKLDHANANASFDRADTIYKALGNFEGQAEVEFQRGSFYDKTSQPEARKHLERALELARTTNNDYQQVKTLQKLGDIEIDANNLVEGRRLMLEAIALAESKSIDNLIKRGLVDLANTFLAEGNYAEAEKYVKQSLELSLKTKDPRNAARARLVLASLAERQGNSAQTISYIEQALPFYQQGGYRKELLQALVLLGRAKSQQGEYAAAGQAFDQQLKLSEQYNDQSLVEVAHEDIGLLLVKQGKHSEAIKHFEKSYEIAKSLGLKKNVAASLIFRANALARLGRNSDARNALNEASAFAEQPDAPKNTAANYFMTQARMALIERRFPDALANSQKALALAGSQKRFALMATFTIGVSEAMSGSASGKAKCEEAVATARQIADPLLLSESLLMSAEAKLQSRDSAGALKDTMEAQELSARLGSSDTEMNAWVLAARANRGLGNLQTARDCATRADNLMRSFEQVWGSNDYNSFLNRPDIHFSRTQLNEILAQK